MKPGTKDLTDRLRRTKLRLAAGTIVGLALMKRAALLVLLLLVAGVAFFLLSQTLREEGFYSPVYSPDGSEVFFIARETSGLVLGFGFECFSPPAHVFVWKDRFTLLRLLVEDGSIEIAKTWPGSPLERQWLRTYRGRLFTVPSTRLQWDDLNTLQYRVRLRTPRQPTAEHFFLTGIIEVQVRELPGSPASKREYRFYAPWAGTPHQAGARHHCGRRALICLATIGRERLLEAPGNDNRLRAGREPFGPSTRPEIPLFPS